MASIASWRLVGTGDQEPFVVAGEVIVGRSKQADLCIREGFVSRRHARLWIEAGRLMVEDLGSANGTFINGERVHHAKVLLAGDIVRFDVFDYGVEPVAAEEPASGFDFDSADSVDVDDLDDGDRTGPSRFDTAPEDDEPAVEFELDSPVEDAASGVEDDGLPPVDEPDFELTGAQSAFGGSCPHSEPDLDLTAADPDFQTTPQPEQQRLAATVAIPSQESEAVQRPPEESLDDPVLLGLAPPVEGHLFQLSSGRIVIGRGGESDIVIDHATVSRQHLEIQLSGGRCRMQVLTDEARTELNGKPVTTAELLPGDVVMIGGVEILYDLASRLGEEFEGAGTALPPWLWMIVGFVSAGAVLGGLFLMLH